MFRIYLIIFIIHHRVVVVSSEKYRNERQPYDAGGVHGEANIFSFIEVWGNFPGLDSVDCTEDDEDHVVDQGEYQGEGGDATCLDSTEVDDDIDKLILDMTDQDGIVIVTWDALPDCTCKWPLCRETPAPATQSLQ